MSELWDLLEQIDALTKTLASGVVSGRWSKLSRDERRLVGQKIRESYLRTGHALTEWAGRPRSGSEDGKDTRVTGNSE